MEVYVHLLSDIWPVQLSIDLAPLTPCTTSYLEDSSSYRLVEVLIVETLKLRLTPSGLVITGCTPATHTHTHDLPIPLPRVWVYVRVGTQRPIAKPVWVYMQV